MSAALTAVVVVLAVLAVLALVVVALHRRRSGGVLMTTGRSPRRPERSGGQP